jgi:hypothetical protein
MKKLVRILIFTLLFAIVTPVALSNSTNVSAAGNGDYIAQVVNLDDTNNNTGNQYNDITTISVKNAAPTYRIQDGAFERIANVSAGSVFPTNIKIISSKGNNYYKIDDSRYLLEDQVNVKAVTVTPLAVISIPVVANVQGK